MKEFKEIEKKLTMEGKIVLPPAFYSKAEGIKHSNDVARVLFELHLDKIDISDGIFVIDVGEYIGDSTRKEIEYARSRVKSIRYYSKEAGRVE
jgi:hypothetical protein